MTFVSARTEEQIDTLGFALVFWKVDRKIRFPEKGMVFTCEPGIYIREEDLGIRLENDILVTDDKPFDLMQKIPLEAEEIESLMN